MQDSMPCASEADEEALRAQREISIAILNERAQRFRKEGSTDSESLDEMIVFLQAGTQYAVPLDILSEIRPITKITALPMVNRSIMGLINVRGRIVPLYVLAVKNENDKLHEGFALVGYGNAAHLAIWAEDIVGTVKVSVADIKPSPISLGEKDYIKGVGNNGMVYLDLNKFVNNQKLYMA